MWGGILVLSDALKLPKLLHRRLSQSPPCLSPEVQGILSTEV